MHDKLVVPVMMQALHSDPVAAHAKHARRRITCKDQPIRFQRMELRMNHSSRERNQSPFAAVARPVTMPDCAPCLIAAVSHSPSALSEHSPNWPFAKFYYLLFRPGWFCQYARWSLRVRSRYATH